MAREINDSFFAQYGRHFSSLTIKKEAVIPFKDHVQFPLLVDILSRKNSHHVTLNIDFSAKLHIPFLEAFLQYLANDQIPLSLRDSELIYLDMDDPIFSQALTKAKEKAIQTDFQQFCDALSKDKYVLIVLTKIDILKHIDNSSFIRNQLTTLLHHPACRFLALTKQTEHPLDQSLEHQFDHINIQGPTEWDVMTILKQQRVELEAFHHVIIPEELLSLTYSLAERYLSTSHTLEKALLLLDSSAARAANTEQVSNQPQLKPVLSMASLTTVLSGWTQIPPTHLQLNRFKLHEFIQSLEQKIYGQDAAITLLGYQLLQAQAHLQQKPGPFCSLLFTGPQYTGKKATAMALAEQLFKQLNVLYSVSPTITHSLAEIKVQRHVDKEYLPLKEAIRQTPYAIILFENIDHTLATIRDGLEEILSTGYLHDQHGYRYDFRQSIILMTTTLGTHRLAEIAKSFAPEEETNETNLMELILNEQKRATVGARHYSPQEIADEMRLEIMSHLSPALCQHLTIVPFLPLTKATIEKIIRLRLKILGKHLDARYGIDLGYAPEVIRYLTNEALKKQKIDHQVVNIDKELKPLYFTLEQAILSQADNKNRPNHLFLQLNETGQLLRCDWITMTAIKHHAT